MWEEQFRQNTYPQLKKESKRPWGGGREHGLGRGGQGVAGDGFFQFGHGREGPGSGGGHGFLAFTFQEE